MNYINKKGFIFPLLFLLSACGGGGSSSSNEDSVTSVTTPDSTTIESPIEESIPEEIAPEETENDPISIDTCIDTSILTITASDDGAFDPLFPPANVLDNDTSEESRWSNLGIGKELTLDFGESIEITNVAILWYRASVRTSNFEIQTSNDNSAWTSVLAPQASTITNSEFELYELTPSNARYLKLIGNGNSDSDWNSVIELVTNHCGDLSELNNTVVTQANSGYDGTNILPPVKPLIDENSIPHTIELIDWYLNTPETDLDDAELDAVRIDEDDLAAGYEDDDYFYPSADGGLIFRATVAGAKTSVNTKFTRTELREMLRRNNTSIKTQGINGNNWVFGSATSAQQNAAGGIDGTLNATLAVNYVTITGDSNQVGRVIIGQIHANDDEPIRLYYRKLPNNTKGSIYFAHEPLGKDDEYVEMIGTRSDSASDPIDGIELNEKFGYTIDVVGDQLDVTITRDGKADVTASYDMSTSGYYPSTDGEEQYMYFKAGAYNQNNTGLDIDYVQTTFYEITNSHTNYNP